MKSFKIHVCPECGSDDMTLVIPNEGGSFYGHYHEPPDDWPENKPDPWINAVEVEVVRADELLKWVGLNIDTATANKIEIEIRL